MFYVKLLRLNCYVFNNQVESLHSLLSPAPESAVTVSRSQSGAAMGGEGLCARIWMFYIAPNVKSASRSGESIPVWPDHQVTLYREGGWGNRYQYVQTARLLITGREGGVIYTTPLTRLIGYRALEPVEACVYIMSHLIDCCLSRLPGIVCLPATDSVTVLPYAWVIPCVSQWPTNRDGHIAEYHMSHGQPQSTVSDMEVTTFIMQRQLMRRVRYRG